MGNALTFLICWAELRVPPLIEILRGLVASRGQD